MAPSPVVRGPHGSAMRRSMVGTEKGIRATPKNSKNKNRHESGNDNFRRDLKRIQRQK
jgi:hypothetical protein